MVPFIKKLHYCTSVGFYKEIALLSIYKEIALLSIYKEIALLSSVGPFYKEIALLCFFL